MPTTVAPAPYRRDRIFAWALYARCSARSPIVAAIVSGSCCRQRDLRHRDCDPGLYRARERGARQIVRLIRARLIYNDGLVVIFRIETPQ